MEETKFIEIKNILKTYHTLDGETKALDHLSFDVDRGEIITIVGPSGCGKSTILSIIAGLVKPSSGEVFINGQQTEGPNRSIGYMFQSDHLFQWRTIMENVLIGLEIQNKVNQESIERVTKLLDTYGLKDFKNHYPNQLSGGMRQRVALIRTLAIEPELLLLDEPFSALDYQSRLAVSDDIAGILKREKKTAIMVTHDIAEAISMANRVLVLSKRPASIKSIHEIKLTCSAERTPLKCREAPEFRHYFNEIWKELDVYVK
ncbi:ABC-type nitrate/sulfonate/bicarbonate transport system, ATpase component [Clostridium aceticum]|uniref:ABC-type nitrate/sulfonate/bicarbonate transport system, ATpase component n=1 Tax=Clostridium aceticum TaxID=84022 RepID=A0A0G3W8G3_9CLOT|nr:ABC transporter ATP-binding protein [Clostridium aceticum]AKL94197.1 ABC-type nitrate/sulfonate/bicarbonate transport system, ATpase component [Clostridium aceticum]